jgi:hypothetical protein
MLTYKHGAKQMMDTPVGFRLGSEAQFSKEMKIVSNYGFSDRAFFNCNMQTAMKKNWNVGVHFHFDNKRCAKAEEGKAAQNPIQLGFDLHYKCDDLLSDD